MKDTTRSTDHLPPALREGNWIVKSYPFSSGPTPEEWAIGIEVKRGLGATVAYFAPKELPNGQRIELLPIRVTSNDQITYWRDYQIPADFETVIELWIESNKDPILQVKLLAWILVDPGHPQFELSVPLDEFGPEWVGKRGISKGINHE